MVTPTYKGGQKVEIIWAGRYLKEIWKKEILMKKKRTAIEVQLSLHMRTTIGLRTLGNTKLLLRASAHKSSFLVED